jgi:hypothetical protein
MKREIGSKAMLKGFITHLLFFLLGRHCGFYELNFFLFKINFLYIFELYIDVKNYFFKKYYFNIFLKKQLLNSQIIKIKKQKGPMNLSNVQRWAGSPNIEEFTTPASDNWF